MPGNRERQNAVRRVHVRQIKLPPQITDVLPAIKAKLRKLVKNTVSIVEQHYVKEALGLAKGNRTATAELLGLSRQSLYAKLNRYGLDDKGPSVEETSED